MCRYLGFTLGRDLRAATVQQPRRTTVNIDEKSRERICLFAGISEHRRTPVALCIRLCTAEVRGSNPLGYTFTIRCFEGIISGKFERSNCWWDPLQPPKQRGAAI